MFNITDRSAKPGVDIKTGDEVDRWWETLEKEARTQHAQRSSRGTLSSADIEALARQVFTDFQERATNAGCPLPDSFLPRLVGELSGLGPLLVMIARPDVEDIAINMGHIYIYTTSNGWEHAAPAPESMGGAIRLLIDRAGQRAPTPDYPIADAMLQVMVPTPDGQVRRKGVRINYIMPPASPYGDTITLRVSNYRNEAELKEGSLALLCQSRLPAVQRPTFTPLNLPRGNGVLTPEAANYLLSVMVHGGTIIVAGTTGSGKTFIAQRILQEMLDYYPRGALRLFIVEDSNEIVLNGWDGNQKVDTGNIVYTVTRPEVRGGAPPVTMYDLIRAAMRSRPHGVIIGEARGAEAWELIRAAATGHGHSAFTIHATSAEHVWARFAQVVQAHPDAQRLSEYQIAQSFAEAVTAVVFIERGPLHGQIVREIAEVADVVERTAGRPSFSMLFRHDNTRGLVPTGNRPTRLGYRASDLRLPETYFRPT